MQAQQQEETFLKWVSTFHLSVRYLQQKVGYISTKDWHKQQASLSYSIGHSLHFSFSFSFFFFPELEIFLKSNLYGPLFAYRLLHSDSHLDISLTKRCFLKKICAREKLHSDSHLDISLTKTQFLLRICLHFLFTFSKRETQLLRHHMMVFSREILTTWHYNNSSSSIIITVFSLIKI